MAKTIFMHVTDAPSEGSFAGTVFVRYGSKLGRILFSTESPLLLCRPGDTVSDCTFVGAGIGIEKERT